MCERMEGEGEVANLGTTVKQISLKLRLSPDYFWYFSYISFSCNMFNKVIFKKMNDQRESVKKVNHL